MKIFLVQLEATVGAVGDNLARMERQVEKASAAGADLVVFPEMSDTGYAMDAILREASPWNDGPFTRLAEAARRNRVAVVAGISERAADGVYNSVAVLDASGTLVAKHRKTHLMRLGPVCEAAHLRAGASLVTFELGGFRFGIVVCYEIRFPEIARALALAGVECLLVPAAFPAARRAHWRTLTEARAIENQAYVLAVNRVGNDAGLVHGGASRAIDPWGVVLAEAPEATETTLAVELDRSQLERVRGGLRVFEDRREAVYRRVDGGTGGGFSAGKPR